MLSNRRTNMKKLLIGITLLSSMSSFAHINYVSEGVLSISLDSSTLKGCKDKTQILSKEIKDAGRALLDSEECFNFKEGATSGAHYTKNVLSYITSNAELQFISTFNSSKLACEKEVREISQELRSAKAIIIDISECIKISDRREDYQGVINFN